MERLLTIILKCKQQQPKSKKKRPNWSNAGKHFRTTRCSSSRLPSFLSLFSPSSNELISYSSSCAASKINLDNRNKYLCNVGMALLPLFKAKNVCKCGCGCGWGWGPATHAFKKALMIGAPGFVNIISRPFNDDLIVESTTLIEIQQKKWSSLGCWTWDI